MRNIMLFCGFVAFAACSSSDPGSAVKPEGGSGGSVTVPKDGGSDTVAVQPVPDSSVKPDDLAPVVPDVMIAAETGGPEATAADAGSDTVSVANDGPAFVGSDVAALDGTTESGPDAKVPDALSDKNTDTTTSGPETNVSAPEVSLPPVDTSPPNDGPLTKADTAVPACVAKGDYTLCGDGTGCCSSSYVNAAKAPGNDYVDVARYQAVRTESSPQLYLSAGSAFVKFSAAAALEWNSACTSACLYAVPASANGCARVQQYADSDFQDLLDSGTYTLNAASQGPFRPGTVILVNGGNKYVASGQGRTRTLQKLNPPSLADSIFPGTAAAREQAVSDAYMSMYKMGTDITAAAQYDPVAACNDAASLMMEFM